MEFCNKWMGKIPIYTNDCQEPDDISKLFSKFGERRAMKIVNGSNNFGKSNDSIESKVVTNERAKSP